MCRPGDFPPYEDQPAAKWQPVRFSWYCAGCGARKALHSAHPTLTNEWGEPVLLCPSKYRPDNLEAAIRSLEDAQRRSDPEMVFVARGDVQRFLGHAPDTCSPRCPGCAALATAMKEAR